MKLAKQRSNNRWLHDIALVREPLGRKGNAELWICHSPLFYEYMANKEFYAQLGLLQHPWIDPDALNGYVAYPNRHAPVRRFAEGMVRFIPVHGGCNYAQKDSFAAVWGFDTHHAYSKPEEAHDVDWMRFQCHLLYSGLEYLGGLKRCWRRMPTDARTELGLQMSEAINPAARQDVEALAETMVRLWLGGSK